MGTGMPHAADRHDPIRVCGARQNNLKNISVELPKRRLTVFTGVSGSGKRSLVFGTIAAESQRLVNETCSAFLQGFMPNTARPEVDLLEGLTTAIIVDQERMGANPRSTVGPATDVNAMLRIVFSRLGQPHIGSAQAFSFNVASISGAGAVTLERGGTTVKERRSFSITGGMCPRCEGLGSVTHFDLTQLYDDSKSLNQGALTVPGYTVDGWYGRIFSGAGFFDPDKPIRKFTKRELHDLLHKEPVKIKVDGINLTYNGLIPKISKSLLVKDREAMQPHIRAFVDRSITFTACPDCGGTRLSEAARSSKIKGISIADACAMQISDLAGWVRELHEPSVAPLLAALGEMLDSFGEIGLGYLSLDRPTGTLSGGESQRTKMIRHLGSSLTDVTYVYDEPTIGLHPPRHPTHERPAAAPARQGQHRAGRRARARDDRHRRPRRRSWPWRGDGGRRGLLRGHRGGAAGQRHPHRPPLRRPGDPQVVGAHAHRHARGPRGEPTQPARRRRRPPARSAVRVHRRGRLGQELRSSPARCPGARGWYRSTRAPSRAPGAATRRRTQGCSSRSARRSPRPTASSRRCSAPTPRARARPATAPAFSTPTSR
jgi:energy-coupling factor transporter ATP-binding protein EcfA2